jgi:hypothetical protein
LPRNQGKATQYTNPNTNRNVLFGYRLSHVGICPLCRQKSTPKLVARHLTYFRDWLANRGIKTMMWHDMMLDRKTWRESAPANSIPASEKRGGYTHPALDLIPKDILMAVWIYDNFREYPALKYFQKKGFAVYGCPWYETENNLYFANAVKQVGGAGFIGTTWNYSPGVNTIFTSVMTAEYAWSPTM